MRELTTKLKKLNQHRHFPLLMLCLVMATSLLINGARISSVNLWADEVTTITTAQLPVEDLLRGSYSKELNPPLYFLMLKAWIAIFGTVEQGLRLTSLVFALAAQVVMFVLGTQIGGWKMGLGASLFLVFNGLNVFHAADIRMYSMLVFTALLALLAFERWSQDMSRGWWATVLVACTLGMLIHFAGLLIPLGLGLLSLLRLKLRQERSQAGMFASLTLVVLVTLPVYFYYLQGRTQVLAGYVEIKPQIILDPSLLLVLLAGVSDLRFDFSDPVHMISLGASLMGAWRLWRIRRTDLALGMPLYMAFCTVASLLASCSGMNIINRYLIHVQSLAGLLIAANFANPGSSQKAKDQIMKPASTLPEETKLYEKLISALPMISAVAALGLVSIGGVNIVRDRTGVFVDYRPIAETIKASAFLDEPVVLLGWDARPVEYYLQRSTYTSFDLEAQAAKGFDFSSYILVFSPHGRSFSYPEGSGLHVLYDDSSVQVVRFIPPLLKKPTISPASP